MDTFADLHDDAMTVTFETEDGTVDTIETTPEHPFFVIGQGFIPAGQLSSGMPVETSTRSAAQVVSVDRTSYDLIAYNLSVEEYHTYYVGEQGLWVHNTCSVDPAKRPEIGGGGTLDKLTPGEVSRIQNAANRSGQEIAVVGSRVNPDKPLHSKSDFDFVIDANSKTRSNLSRSLPGAKNVSEGIPNNQDIFKGSVDPNKPHVIFRPE